MALQRLRRHQDWDIAADSIDIRGWRIYDGAGVKRGVIADLLFEPDTGLVRQAVADLWDRRVLLPVADLAPEGADRRVVALEYDGARFDALEDFDPRAFEREQAPAARPERTMEGDHETIRLLAERLEVGKVRKRAGEVVVTKTPVVTWLEQALALDHEELEIRREVVDLPATGHEAIEMDGDEIRIPVLGEKVVIERRPVVKEIVTIRKKTAREHVTVREPVRHEEIGFEGLPGPSGPPR